MKKSDVFANNLGSFGRIENSSLTALAQIMHITEGKIGEHPEMVSLKERAERLTYSAEDMQILLIAFEEYKYRELESFSASYALCVCSFFLEGNERNVLPKDFASDILAKMSGFGDKYKNIIIPLLIKQKNDNSPGHWTCIIISTSHKKIIFFDPHAKEFKDSEYSSEELKMLEDDNRIGEFAEIQAKKISLSTNKRSYFFSMLKKNLENSELVTRDKYKLYTNERNYQSMIGGAGLTECGSVTLQFIIRSIENCLWEEKIEGYRELDNKILVFLSASDRTGLFKILINHNFISREIRDNLCHILIDMISEKEFRPNHMSFLAEHIERCYQADKEYKDLVRVLPFREIVSLPQLKEMDHLLEENRKRGNYNLPPQEQSKEQDREKTLYILAVQQFHRTIVSVCEQEFAKGEELLESIELLTFPQEYQDAILFVKKAEEIFQKFANLGTNNKLSYSLGAGVFNFEERGNSEKSAINQAETTQVSDQDQDQDQDQYQDMSSNDGDQEKLEIEDSYHTRPIFSIQGIFGIGASICNWVGEKIINICEWFVGRLSKNFSKVDQNSRERQIPGKDDAVDRVIKGGSKGQEESSGRKRGVR